MSLFDSRRTKIALTTAGLLAVGACDDATPPMAPDAELTESPAAIRAPASALGVMTWNAYLGADTGPLYSLDFPDPGEDSQEELIAKTGALLAAVNTFWAGVQATDFPERAAAIAREIADADPEVVALQEIASYGVIDLSSGAPVPIGGIDFVPVLEQALAAEGLHYDVVIRQTNTEGTFPLEIDPSTFQPSSVLAFTLGEITLVRSDVKVLESESAEYAVNLDLGPVSIDRGWSLVRVKHDGTPYNVLNTHLEIQGVRPVHDAQAAELIDGVLARLDGATVLVGDLNSDAFGAQDASNPKWTPTWGLLRDAGFEDTWLQAAETSGAGPTCCYATLAGDPSELASRIDFVMVRRPGGAFANERSAGFEVSSAHILGDDTDEQTASGLWPSDHAGVVAEFAFPNGAR